MIQLRKLGHSDLEVSPIGLGVMQFAGGSGAIQAVNPALPEETRIEIVKTAMKVESTGLILRNYLALGDLKNICRKRLRNWVISASERLSPLSGLPIYDSQAT